MPLAQIAGIEVEQHNGQAFYHAADLKMLDAGGHVTLTLAGVPRADVFRQTILEARDARNQVEAALTTIGSRGPLICQLRLTPRFRKTLISINRCKTVFPFANIFRNQTMDFEVFGKEDREGSVALFPGGGFFIKLHMLIETSTASGQTFTT